MASGAITKPTSDMPDEPGERPVSKSAQGGGMFAVYKKGQGYYTRLGTALGAGLLIACTLLFLYQQLKVSSAFQTQITDANGVVRIVPRSAWLVGTVTAAGLVLAGIAWSLMNKPANAEFLINTDSEMKKVNWTSWKVLVGSTKVVIFFMFATAIFLFVVDVVFGYFFHLIKVLNTSPFGA